MSRASVVAGLLLMGFLSVPGISRAQILGTGVIPVTEVGVSLKANTVTAAQSIITATHAVMSVANQVLELTPVDEIVLGTQLASDLALLGDIVSNAELVWYDIQSLDAQLTALFDLKTAPTTRTALDARVTEIRALYYRMLCYAMRTQTLMLTILGTIDHVQRLVSSIGAFVGHMQANQTLVQVQTTTSTTLAVMEVQQAAWQRADTIERLTAGVITESLQKIAEVRLASHPR